MKYIKVHKVKSDSTLYDNDSGENFWGNIGAGILCVCKKTKRILIGYRSKEVNEPHTWGVIGGKLDEETNIKKVALREFKEETEFKGKIKLIPAYIFQTKGFKYHNFIGIINTEFKPKLDWETEKVKWVTFDQLLKIKPKHFGLKKLLKDKKSLETIRQQLTSKNKKAVEG